MIQRTKRCDQVLSVCADLVEEERLKNGEFERKVEGSSKYYYPHLLERMFPDAHRQLATQTQAIREKSQ